MNEFLQAVFLKFNRHITDQVFLLIQEDRELMKLYLEQVQLRGHDFVNREIGREVRAQYDLENEDGPDDREKSPISVLIQDHQRFKVKPSSRQFSGE